MAGGVTDDHGPGPSSPEPAGHAAEGQPAEPSVTPVAESRQSEWTVSDRRGPLHEAPPSTGSAVPPDGDVERIVPGSEMDAEGALDPGSNPLHAAPAHADLPLHSGEPEIDTAHPAVSAESVAGPAVAGAAAPDPGPGVAAAPPRRSPWPIAAALVLGAIIGAGSAAGVYAYVAGPHSGRGTAPPADAGRLAALESRVDAIGKGTAGSGSESAIAGLKSRVDDLAGKVAALQARPAPPAGGSAAPAPDLGGLQAKVAALQDEVGKLGALQAAVAGTQALATATRASAEAVKAQQRDLDGKVGSLQAAAGEAQKQTAAVQAGLDGVRADQKALAGKVGAPALAVVADSLVGQIEGGKPFAPQVEALASLGADPARVAVLRQNAGAGVPSAQVLLAKFQPLADGVVATASKAPANAGFTDRLKRGLFGLVSVRRADETTGSDLPSRVALLEANLGHGDVGGAYAVWTAFPPDAKARSDAWGALAKTSVEAIAAARSLQNEAITALAAKRS